MSSPARCAEDVLSEIFELETRAGGPKNLAEFMYSFFLTKHGIQVSESGSPPTDLLLCVDFVGGVVLSVFYPALLPSLSGRLAVSSSCMMVVLLPVDLQRLAEQYTWNTLHGVERFRRKFLDVEIMGKLLDGVRSFHGHAAVCFLSGALEGACSETKRKTPMLTDLW